MPSLGSGEFYLATDTAALFVGFMGGTIKVLMAIQIQDSAGNSLTSTSGALDVNIKSNVGDSPIPISAASLPLPSNSAQETGGNLASIASGMTSGSQKSQIVNGSGTVADVTAHGTQGANFLSVQAALDSGRTPICLLVDSVAGVTTEALATMTMNKGGSVSSGTAYTVTSGKTFRVTQMVIAVVNPATTNASARIRLRSAATVAASSPIFVAGAVGGPSAIANAAGTMTIDIPDGIEFAGGQQVGISHVDSSTITSGINVCVIGFEY